MGAPGKVKGQAGCVNGAPSGCKGTGCPSWLRCRDPEDREVQEEPFRAAQCPSRSKHGCPIRKTVTLSLPPSLQRARSDSGCSCYALSPPGSTVVPGPPHDGSPSQDLGQPRSQPPAPAVVCVTSRVTQEASDFSEETMGATSCSTEIWGIRWPQS